MLIKYSNASLSWIQKPSRPTNGLYPVLYGYATYAEADKAKKEIQKTDNPEAWLLIESL
jgi:hypothetical protein